jgi:hypothetical protein
MLVNLGPGLHLHYGGTATVGSGGQHILVQQLWEEDRSSPSHRDRMNLALASSVTALMATPIIKQQGAARDPQGVGLSMCTHARRFWRRIMYLHDPNPKRPAASQGYSIPQV